MSGEHSQGLLTGEFQEKSSATGRFSAIRNISWSALLHSIGHALKPEIFERRALSAAQKRPGTTAWLDGLRGVAALSVCTMHLCVYTHTNLELCYGAGIWWQKWNTSIAAWPIFRLPFTGGHFAVILFFTISGYVVPRRLISLLHEGKQAEFVEAINAAIVRRPGRLFLPVAFSTLFLAFFWHITGIVTAFPQRQSNIFTEVWAWFLDQMKFWYYYRTGFLFTYYNAHTWTIPVELRGSMNIFLWLFAVHQVRTKWRILMTVGILAHFIYASGAWYAAFFAGMLTSELDMIYTNGVPVNLPWDPIVNFFRKREMIKQGVLHVMLFVGLWLASQPSSDMHSRDEVMDCGAWNYLNKLIPDPYNDGNNTTYRWFWLFWAAWIILVTVGQIGWVKWLFETGPAQCKWNRNPRTGRIEELTRRRSRSPLIRALSRPRPYHRSVLRPPLLPHRRKDPLQRRRYQAVRTSDQQVERFQLVDSARRRTVCSGAQLHFLCAHVTACHVVRG